MNRQEELTPIERSWGAMLQGHQIGRCLEASELVELAEAKTPLPAASSLQHSMQHVLFCSVCQDRLMELRRVEQMRAALPHNRRSLPWLGQLLRAQDSSHRSPLLLGGVTLAGLAAVLILGIVFVTRNQPGSQRPSNFYPLDGTPGTAVPQVEILSPIRETQSDGPRVQWKALPAATSYRVRLVEDPGAPASFRYDKDFELKRTFPWYEGTSWQLPPRTLTPGKSYLLSIEAYDKGENPIAKASAPFKVQAK